MTHLILHRFGAKYSKVGNKRIIEPDFNTEETENNGNRQYIFGIELDKNERDNQGNEIANTKIRDKLIGKNLAAIKVLLKAKPKSQAFTSITTNGRRKETFLICDHCAELIDKEING